MERRRQALLAVIAVLLARYMSGSDDENITTIISLAAGLQDPAQELALGAAAAPALAAAPSAALRAAVAGAMAQAAGMHVKVAAPSLPEASAPPGPPFSGEEAVSPLRPELRRLRQEVWALCPLPHLRPPASSSCDQMGSLPLPSMQMGPPPLWPPPQPAPPLSALPPLWPEPVVPALLPWLSLLPPSPSVGLPSPSSGVLTA